SSKIITSILSFISGRLATKSNQIKQLIRNGRSASLQRTFKKSFTSFSHSTRNKTRDGLIRVRNIRALNGRLDRKSGSAGMPRPISYAVFGLKKKNRTGEGPGQLDVHIEPVARRGGRGEQEGDRRR